MVSWEKWYDLAKNYYLEFGNLLVPASYITVSGEKLGQWISKQRSYYNGIMTQHQKVHVKNIPGKN